MDTIRFAIVLLVLTFRLTGPAVAAGMDEEGPPSPSPVGPGLNISVILIGPTDAGIEPLNLPELLTAAFNSNPRIARAHMEWRAAVEKYPQMRSWPDPKLNFSWFPQPIETRNGSNDFAVQLMQMIPNPRKLKLKGKRALTMAEMAQVKYEKVVRDVLVDVMVSYYELGYLDAAITIAKANAGLFTQLVELADLRFAQGELGAPELYSAESRLSQAKYELGLLVELRATEAAIMRKRLGLPPDAPIGPVDLPPINPTDLNLETIRTLVLEHRHELEMAGILVDIAGINLSIAKSMREPDFSLGVMYNSIGISPMSEGMFTSGKDAYGIMFGVTIPLWGGKNKARVAEAQSELSAAEANLEEMTNMAGAAADRIFYRLLNQGRLAQLYRDTLLPEAENAAALAQTWYEAGQAPFSQLLESRLVVGNFEFATARAKADYLISLAELGRLAGVPVTGAEGETSNEDTTQSEEVPV